MCKHNITCKYKFGKNGKEYKYVWYESSFNVQNHIQITK